MQPPQVTRLYPIALAVFVFAQPLTCLAGETVQLQTTCRTSDLTRVTATLAVEGTLQVRAEGAEQTLPLEVKAHFAYDEAALGPAADSTARHAARYYRDAEAQITINKRSDSPKIRKEHRLIAVDSGPAGFVISSPNGPLSREELDLIDIPGNSLAVEALLPRGHLKADEKWSPAEAGLKNLLGLDAISNSTVRCSLLSKTEKLAEIAFAGRIDGAVAGVSTVLELDGNATFDRRENRLSSIQMRIKERRSVGHVSPGLDVTANLKMEIVPLAGSDQLTEKVLKGLGGKTAKRPHRFRCTTRRPDSSWPTIAAGTLPATTPT